MASFLKKDIRISGTFVPESKKNIMFYIKKDILLYLLLIVPLAHYLIFRYLPMYGALIAFKDYNIFAGVFKSPWVGLDVFKEIFALSEFYRAVQNTLFLNFLDIFFGFPAPIILALILNEIKPNWIKRGSQSILYIPHFLSWVIIGGIAYQLFSTNSGLVNHLLASTGLDPIPFLTNKNYWLILYTSLGVWQNIGWGSILYMGAIAGISQELFDAADVDGAGRLRRIWHIILPGIRPTIVILFILTIGKIAAIGFDRPYVIGNAIVRDYSDVISTFVYRIGFEYARYNVAAAVGLFQSLINVVLLLTSNFIVKKCGEDGIW